MFCTTIPIILAARHFAAYGKLRPISRLPFRYLRLGIKVERVREVLRCCGRVLRLLSAFSAELRQHHVGTEYPEVHSLCGASEPLRGGPREEFAIFRGKQVAVTGYDDLVLWIWICSTFLYSETPTT
ncbi:uncharacterized protein LOC101713193 isoform X1 [Heterocephalus glaber]|uniref:Uncharacterized protein LOC101713193 isoform X1 n=1 Tax=Heterocephalus glaber TaxID=10181 RepID=A0AAX6STT0_HETGA|nr:uncharacterized protein LOC101713193 isoform X1 [Heterocephalus glaber]